MKNMNRVEKAIQYIPCPTCGARPKKPCKTKSGNSYGGRWFAHEPRLTPFSEEFWHGVRFGESLHNHYADA